MYCHQLDKSPLNYSFGRVEHEMDNGHSAQRMTVSLFPGFARPNDVAPWAVTVTIRFYADSAQALVPADERALTLGPAEARSMRFTSGPARLAIPSGYVPLGLVLARTGDDEIWATEELLSPLTGVGA